MSEVDSEAKNGKKIATLVADLYAPHLRSWRQGRTKVGFRKDKLMMRYPGQGD